MPKTYKVWIEVEEMVEDEDRYENIDLPECLKEFDNLEDAEIFRDCVTAAFAEDGTITQPDPRKRLQRFRDTWADLRKAKKGA